MKRRRDRPGLKGEGAAAVAAVAAAAAAAGEAWGQHCACAPTSRCRSNACAPPGRGLAGRVPARSPASPPLPATCGGPPGWVCGAAAPATRALSTVAWPQPAQPAP